VNFAIISLYTFLRGAFSDSLLMEQANVLQLAKLLICKGHRLAKVARQVRAVLEARLEDELVEVVQLIAIFAA
jgi:hypothetical protein